MNAITLSESTGLWSELAEYIVENFDTVGAFNLLRYDYNFLMLASELEHLKSFNFDEKQILIFTLYDTEYYLHNSQIGLTLENLIELLRRLDINLKNCVIFTNHHGISKHIKNIIPEINVFENNFSKSQTMAVAPSITRCASDIAYHYCLMNNVKRDHRSIIWTFFQENHLLSKTIASWHNSTKRDHPERKEFNNFKKSNNYYNFLILIGFCLFF